MGKALVAVSLLCVLTACKGLYVDKPDPLKNPPTHKPPKVATTEEPIPFIDACTVDFSGTPVSAKKRNTTASADLTNKGNNALDTASPGNAARPANPAQVTAAQDAITKYREALIKDPYNAEATLKLALAYDRMLRKGCALAMLHRLETLASNANFEKAAVPMIDRIVQNPHWFKPYYTEALKAVGH